MRALRHLSWLFGVPDTQVTAEHDSICHDLVQPRYKQRYQVLNCRHITPNTTQSIYSISESVARGTIVFFAIYICLSESKKKNSKATNPSITCLEMNDIQKRVIALGYVSRWMWRNWPRSWQMDDHYPSCYLLAVEKSQRNALHFQHFLRKLSGLSSWGEGLFIVKRCRSGIRKTNKYGWWLASRWGCFNSKTRQGCRKRQLGLRRDSVFSMLHCKTSDKNQITVILHASLSN